MYSCCSWSRGDFENEMCSLEVPIHELRKDFYPLLISDGIQTEGGKADSIVDGFFRLQGMSEEHIDLMMRGTSFSFKNMLRCCV